MKIKICKKCSYARKTDDSICGIGSCTGELKFWVSNNEELLNAFINKCINEKWGDLTQKVLDIESTDYRKSHEGIKIDNVLSRLKTVELLHTDETYGQFIEAGFNIETSLRIYLASTCFDILGQSDDFIQFNSWLDLKNKKKREEELNLLKDTVKKSNNNFIKNITLIDVAKILFAKISGKANINININIFKFDDARLFTKNLHRQYLNFFGMHSAFSRFFNNVLDEIDKNFLLSTFWIVKNQYASEGGITNFYAESKPKNWQKLNEKERLNKIIKHIEILARNNFTHKGIRILDWSDKHHVPQILKKMERLVNNGKTFEQCSNRNELNSKVIDSTSLNNSIVGLDNTNLFYSSSKPTSQGEIKQSLLDACKINDNIIKGGDVYFDTIKKAFCYRGESLAKILHYIAERGLFCYISKLKML